MTKFNVMTEGIPGPDTYDHNFCNNGLVLLRFWPVIKALHLLNNICKRGRIWGATWIYPFMTEGVMSHTQCHTHWALLDTRSCIRTLIWSMLAIILSWRPRRAPAHVVVDGEEVAPHEPTARQAAQVHGTRPDGLLGYLWYETQQKWPLNGTVWQ